MMIEISPWSHLETSTTVREPSQPSNTLNGAAVQPATAAAVHSDEGDGKSRLSRKRHKAVVAASDKPLDEIKPESSPLFDCNSYDIAASFIEALSFEKQSARSRKRRKVATTKGNKISVMKEERIPALVVTSPNQIGVMVVEEENKDNNNNFTNESQISNLRSHNQRIQESSILQFQSRPNHLGTSFLPTSNGNVSMARIPAVYDAQHQRMYAVQKNNTQLVCYYNSESYRTNDDETNMSQLDEQQEQLTCEITIPSSIQSLSILYLPSSSLTEQHRLQQRTGNRKTNSRVEDSGCSIVYGTCKDSKLFIAITKPVRNTFVKSTNSSASVNNNNSATVAHSKLQFVLQYIDTRYTQTASMSLIQSHPSHAGTVAVLSYSSAPVSSSLVPTMTTQSKKRVSIQIEKATQSSESNIVCFTQILYTVDGTIQLVRQHVRILDPLSLTGSESVICSSCSDVQHINTATPIRINHPSCYRYSHPSIGNITLLGTSSAASPSVSDGNIVLSYYCLRNECKKSNNAIVNTREMNGSAKKLPTVDSRATATCRDYFFVTIPTIATKSTTLQSFVSVSSIPFVLPHMDDEVQQACLVTPSIIGVLTRHYKQICMYDIHRGGLIHVDQPFTAMTTNSFSVTTATPVDVPTCISLLTDARQSKIAVLYVSSTIPKKYCIAYASISFKMSTSTGIVIRQNSLTSHMSLADGLIAASSNNIASTNLLYLCQNKTRTIFQEENKLTDEFQNETIVPQQGAINKGTDSFLTSGQSIFTYGNFLTPLVYYINRSCDIARHYDNDNKQVNNRTN
jgi:hypothetical protein